LFIPLNLLLSLLSIINYHILGEETKSKGVYMKKNKPLRNTLELEMEMSLRRLFRTLRKELNELYSDYIPSNEFAVLSTLNNRSPLMASEIANELKVSSSHITAVTDRLVGKSYIQRVRSESDRRIVYLEMTEAGNKIAKEMNQLKNEYIEKRFNSLSDEEMKMMISITKKLLD
jgi:DNA-binding MarR family transcriptional regulator